MKWVHELAGCLYQDAYGVRYFDHQKQKLAYRRVEEPLTPAVIDRHLSKDDEFAAASYVLSDPDSNKGRVVAFDFDDHDGELPDGYMEAVVVKFLKLLDERDFSYVVVRSGGGKGYHVFVVFETAHRKDQLRAFGKKALAGLDQADVRGPLRDPATNKFPRLGIKEGTGGVAKGEIEIFPKGDGTGGMHLLALPLARQSVRMRLVDGELIEAPDDDTLPLVKKRKPGPKPNGKAADRDAAFDALAATLDPADYDQWVKLGHMLVAAFGKDDPWAFERWSAWAMTAPGADPADKQRAKWERDLSSDPRCSPASFWLSAREAGYDGPLPFSKTDESKFKLLEMLGGLEIVRSPDNETFACIGPRNYVPVRSRGFQAYLRRQALANGQLLKTEEINGAVETVDAVASVSEVEDIHLRFAAHADKRYLFLADDACTVVEIDSAGFRVCEDPPVRFRRGDGRALPVPTQGTLDEFRRFVNIDEDNLPFYLAWVACCILRPGLASPIAVLTGPAGSAKSTLLQLTVDLLDPKAGAKAGMPTNEDNLVVAAHNGAVVSFDNASTLATLSDPLCRLSTGGGLRKRTLYTDKDVTAIDVIRPVIISGIDPTAYQQDLIERLLMIELHPPTSRIDDETFKSLVNEARPRLLGFILSLVSRVLALGNVEVTGTRMVGYARIGEAVARILGREPGWFASEYEQMLAHAADEAAEADCVIQLIRQMLANENSRPSGATVIRHSSMGLLERLHEAVQNRWIVASKADVPTNARAMSSRVRRVIEILRKEGITVEQGPERMWIIMQDGPDYAAVERLAEEQMVERGEVVPF